MRNKFKILRINCERMILVRDFAYSEDERLHFGVEEMSSSDKFDKETLPPWEEEEKEDDDNEINCKAIAIFEFRPENENELALVPGQEVWVSYRHGQGWLVAENLDSGETGLIPEEYVELIEEATRFMPDFLHQDGEDAVLAQAEGGANSDSEWEDASDSDEEHQQQHKDEEIPKLQNLTIKE